MEEKSSKQWCNESMFVMKVPICTVAAFKIYFLIKLVAGTRRAQGSMMATNREGPSFSNLASLLSVSPHFQVHAPMCVCRVMIGEFGAHATWLYSYGPLSSIRHNGMLSASARLNLLQCFITCECAHVCSRSTNNASLHVVPGAPLTFLPVSLPSGRHYRFQSYLPSRQTTAAHKQTQL